MYKCISSTWLTRSTPLKMSTLNRYHKVGPLAVTKSEPITPLIRGEITLWFTKLISSHLYILPETNSSHLSGGLPRKLIWTNPSVSGGMLVSEMPTVPFYFCTFCMKMRQNMMRIDYILYSTQYTDMYRYCRISRIVPKVLNQLYIYMHRKICVIIYTVYRTLDANCGWSNIEYRLYQTIAKII